MFDWNKTPIAFVSNFPEPGQSPVYDPAEVVGLQIIGEESLSTGMVAIYANNPVSNNGLKVSIRD